MIVMGKPSESAGFAHHDHGREFGKRLPSPILTLLLS